MSISNLKFKEEEIAAKSITSLADRPAISAAEMKERLDSGDIRTRMNGLIDEIEPAITTVSDHNLNRLIVFPTKNVDAILAAMRIFGNDTKFFGFFLDCGKTFYGTAIELNAAINNDTI